MLSKSSARWFFILGTTVFSLVFLGLTIDTIRQVPSRSNQEKLTPAVKRGHDLWTDNNCMGCHTLLGEGAYYAPELTKVIERRGAAWIKIFLKDPEAMFPGRRKMVKYPFSDQDIDDLVAFFEWIGQIDTNGFPPKPNMVSQVQTANNQDLGHQAFPAGTPEMFSTICISCHAIGGRGGKVGPALDNLATRFSRDQLHAWLKDPQSVKPGTAMPQLPMSDQVRSELVDFLFDYQGGQP
jgi:nitric oxide reductase subunit C